MPTLAELNLLTPEAAEEFFLTCCGSTRWAGHMAACRPFWNVTVVHNAAATIWQYLSPEDQREALRARKTWNEDSLPGPLVEELDLYERKFGYRFVAGPRLAGEEELRSAVRRRFESNPGAEFEIAVAEEARYMMSEVAARITP